MPPYEIWKEPEKLKMSNRHPHTGSDK